MKTLIEAISIEQVANVDFVVFILVYSLLVNKATQEQRIFILSHLRVVAWSIVY